MISPWLRAVLDLNPQILHPFVLGEATTIDGPERYARTCLVPLLSMQTR